MTPPSSRDNAAPAIGTPDRLLHRSYRTSSLVAAALFIAFSQSGASFAAESTQLFQNLQKLANSFQVDDPGAEADDSTEGPKGLAAGDLNNDGYVDVVAGNKDGTVTVLFGIGNGTFDVPKYVQVGGAGGLRDVIIANLDGDPYPEVIAAHPSDGKLYIFGTTPAPASRIFTDVRSINTWAGARCVVAGDFNGDGIPDLLVAGAGDGVREYRGDGHGGYSQQAPIAGISPGPYQAGSAKPVFTMATWRRPLETIDRVAVAYAQPEEENASPGQYIWILSSTQGAPLAISSTVLLSAAEVVYDLGAGFLSPESRLFGFPDLLTALPDSGQVYIRHPTSSGGYLKTPSKQLSVPGGPRAISIADVNGDTWPDLLVVARKADKLSLFLNDQGSLSLSSQSPTGSSPRDVVAADFDHNSLPDAVVINRSSQDVTVHRIDPLNGTFYRTSSAIQIPGGTIAPTIAPLDDREPQNVLYYLTPALGEVNILQITASGQWNPPAHYFMGVRPQSLNVVDVNGDHLLDLVVVSLGDWRVKGGITYRLQNPDHTFGPLVADPPVASGTLLAQVTADFNNDTIPDRVAVYADSRIEFYQGVGKGQFLPPRREQFLYGVRALQVSDLDGDGYLDLVGAGAYQVAAIQNNGLWFTGGAYRKITLPGTANLQGARSVSVQDDNGDGYPDITVVSDAPSLHWYGGAGLTFQLDPASSTIDTYDVRSLDFDGDGVPDSFSLTPAHTTVSFFKGHENGGLRNYIPAGKYAVPSVNQLATGDLDGDGQPDLVGAGQYLWVALSGTPIPFSTSGATLELPIKTPKVVINEILAETTDFIPEGATKPVDCVEIFNGTSATVNLLNWTLQRDGELPSQDFKFPGFLLPPRGRVTVFCTDSVGKLNPIWVAFFKISSEGGTLRLRNAQGQESDVVTYPAQKPDISYARVYDGYDGLAAFIYNVFPNIGSPNYDNGDTSPKLDFKGLDMDLLKHGQWRFRAKAWSPLGLLSLVVKWRHVTTPVSLSTETIDLYDDGLHDDGAAFDGVFAGDWSQPVGNGVPIEFYLSGKDFSGETSTDPGGAFFTALGFPTTTHTLSVPAASPVTLEFSEVVPRNLFFLDEDNQTPDWVELRGGSAAGGEVYLADSLFSRDPSKQFPVSRINYAQVPTVVFLDDTPLDSNMVHHAPLSVNGTSGDSIYLFRQLPNGVREPVDWVKIPPLPQNTAYARLGRGGPFVETLPTPGLANVPPGGSLFFIPNDNGTVDIMFAFSGTGTAFASGDLFNWSAVGTAYNSAAENTHREPATMPQRFFKVR